MGMPQIPDGKNRPSVEETVIDLLESIALEEMAISHVLNAQGEQLQAAASRLKCANDGFAIMESVTKGTNQMLVDLIMKEWLLLVKFNYINDFTKHHNLCFHGGHSAHTGCKEDFMPPVDRPCGVQRGEMAGNLCETCPIRASCKYASL